MKYLALAALLLPLTVKDASARKPVDPGSKPAPLPLIGATPLGFIAVAAMLRARRKRNDGSGV